MRNYSVFVSVWMLWVVVVPVIIAFFLAGISLMQLISTDIIVHIVDLVWPAAMVISDSYACLWSSAGRAKPHTSQHLVASCPCISYAYMSFPAVCQTVLPNHFSYCCTTSVIIHTYMCCKTWSDTTLQSTNFPWKSPFPPTNSVESM